MIWITDYKYWAWSGLQITNTGHDPDYRLQILGMIRITEYKYWAWSGLQITNTGHDPDYIKFGGGLQSLTTICLFLQQLITLLTI